MLVEATIGPPPHALYATPELRCVLLGGSYWGDDVVLFQAAYRRLSDVYVAWLRSQPAASDRSTAAQFAKLMREHCPSLVGCSVDVPFWYQGPSDDWPRWSDDEFERVREARLSRTPEMAQYKKAVLHGMRCTSVPGDDGPRDTRDRAAKPRAKNVVAPMQRTPSLPGMSLEEVRGDASREAISL